MDTVSLVSEQWSLLTQHLTILLKGVGLVALICKSNLSFDESF